MKYSSKYNTTSDGDKYAVSIFLFYLVLLYTSFTYFFGIKALSDMVIVNDSPEYPHLKALMSSNETSAYKGI